MSASEKLSRWDRFVHPLAAVLDFALGCHLRHMSRVFTLEGRTYKVCCDCGKNFDYSLQKMAIVRRRMVRAGLRRLRMRQLRRLRMGHT